MPSHEGGTETAQNPSEAHRTSHQWYSGQPGQQEERGVHGDPQRGKTIINDTANTWPTDANDRP